MASLLWGSEVVARLSGRPRDNVDERCAAPRLLKCTAPDASYRLMYEMSMKDPPQVCRKLADCQQRFGHLPANTRIRCWVPKP